MANDSNDPKEIVSLNKELMSFDVTDMSAEELERRLELAIAIFSPLEQGCGTVCGAKCGTDCATDCSSRCGTVCGIDQPGIT
ncbi:MAG TPA: hypothetical protein VG488_02355 [Candidatus Angelobacter sp.]|nr:hypothetical protein [Candidatus Angelobacter sp.]